ncbi:MAG: ATP-binding cassette domain-containing protein [Endomicrobiaceae bacterium]|nr:ATP-binding cassette domain-containing protein [Endomicrobiaceae bacterium]
MSDIVIQTNNLSKRFKIGTKERLTFFTSLRYKLSGEYPETDLWALKDISFSVRKGEMVAVIGHNGAGKTTLFRILSGIMRQTSGTYNVSEDLSCMFELGLGFNLRFTAIENVYLYGALHGISRKEIDKKMDAIVEFAELDKFMGAKLGEYSSGMISRLAFATVIQTLKGIILVDEVLAVGDIAFQKKCTKAFEKVLNEGHTILFISHGIGEEKRLCSNALYIDHGNQVAFGPVNEVEDMYFERMKIKR